MPLIPGNAPATFTLKQLILKFEACCKLHMKYVINSCDYVLLPRSRTDDSPITSLALWNIMYKGTWIGAKVVGTCSGPSVGAGTCSKVFWYDSPGTVQLGSLAATYCYSASFDCSITSNGCMVYHSGSPYWWTDEPCSSSYYGLCELGKQL